MIGYIYYIINNKNKKRYVGQTINIQKRKNDHYNKLKNNKHINYKLQNDWNKYGEDSFSFEYNQYTLNSKEELDTLEKAFIQQFNSYEDGYNLTLGGDGGNTRGKLSFEDYCLIYIGCQWQGLTSKIGKYLNIDGSTVSAILREKAYLQYKEDADNLSDVEKQKIKDTFCDIFGISKEKKPDSSRTPTHLTEDEYFYCLCVASVYGRGIEAALGRYFDKHKSFLTNGVKGKTKGKAYNALLRYRFLDKEESIRIGKEKFNEWNLQQYSKNTIEICINDRWRN